MKDSSSSADFCLKKVGAGFEDSEREETRERVGEKFDRKLRSSKNPRGNHLNCRKRELFDGGGRGGGAEVAVCHNLPIGNHHAVQAGSRSGGGGKYLWPFVCYWRGFHLFPNEPPTHTHKTNADARMRPNIAEEHVMPVSHVRVRR